MDRNDGCKDVVSQAPLRSFTLWLVIGALLVAACVGGEPATSGQGAAEGTEIGADGACQGETIRMGQSSYTFIYLPLYVAIGSGGFDRMGIEVEFTELGGAATVTQALAAGDLDFTVENAGAILNAASQGAPVRALLSLMDRNGLYVVAKDGVMEEAGIDPESSFEEKVQSLAGKNIAIASPGGGTDQLARYLLREGGLDPDTDAQLIGHDSSAAMVSSFVADRVDAVVTSAPSVYTAIDEGNGVYLWNLPRGDLELTNNMLYTAVGTSLDVIESHPALVECVAVAINEAIQLMASDDDAARAAAREFFADLDEDLYNTAYEDHAAAAPETPIISPESFQRTVELLNAASETPVDIEYDDAVHVDIPQQALGEL